MRMVLLDKCRIIYWLNEFHEPTLFIFAALA